MKELWTGELLEKFRHEGEFLSRIANRNDYVNNNAIHMADIGADPEVLVNNTTYPIEVASREDTDVSIALDKFDTTNTRITDDELYALPYDKNGSVLQQHREVLEEKTASKAAHSLAPTVATLSTTGSSNGETYARKRLTVADIVKAKKWMDDLKIPKKNRELVLCNDHVQDLLLVDEKFAKQYQDIEQGKVLNMYGFIISEFVDNPKYKTVNAVVTKKLLALPMMQITTLPVHSSTTYLAPCRHVAM
ncbi:MAG: hypothetical protein HC896_00085 [Bacteroidales bacterium]|nr:hypothetical protein [Bacteroidales bacterium]